MGQSCERSNLVQGADFSTGWPRCHCYGNMYGPPLKLLILAQSGGLGGVETSLINFVRYVTSKGHEVSVVFWRDAGPVRAAFPHSVRDIDIQTGFAKGIYRTQGVRHALATPGITRRLAALAYIAIRQILRQGRNPWIALKRIPEHFDVAIAYRHEGFGPYYLIDRVDAAKKVMWFHHGSYSPSPMGAAVDREYYEKMDAIVTVSSATKDMLADEFPTISSRIRVIRSIIDSEAIKVAAQERLNDAWRSPGLTLVTVSRLTQEKGVDIAIHAAHVLKERGLQFIWYVVGGGPERNSLERMVRDLGVGDLVVLLGERANPFPYMNLADVYVQTSRTEAYGLAIAEAMVLGKPIVASDIPSAQEVLQDGYFGMTSQLNPRSFADAIMEFAKVPEMRLMFSSRLSGQSARNEGAFREIDRLLEP